jgi:TonB family protein
MTPSELCVVCASVLLTMPAAARQTPSVADPVHVGSQLITPQKIKDVTPVYPENAKSAGVEGLVILEATINEDGKVQDVRVLRSIPLLDEAAIGTVKQWEYAPTLLNGRPVPIIVTMTVNFTLPRQAGDRLLPDALPEDSPCADQPTSLKALTDAFNKGRLPSASDISGKWVETGFFPSEAMASSGSRSRLNCDGLMRGSTFEVVLLVNGLSVEIHMIGTSLQTAMLTTERGSLTFPVDERGDAAPVFRCRLTERQTLDCLVSAYDQGAEFKRISASPDH